MNVHEFQAKQLFAQFGITVPKGKEVKNVGAAEKWAAKLETPVYVVKAQIHAGGRGKAGGVKLTKDRAEVPGLARDLLGKTLVTHQTGPKGRKVRRLLIEEGAAIAKELYLSLLVDRDSGWPVFIASTEGGMEIEEVAATTPERSSRSQSIPPWATRATMAANSRLGSACRRWNRPSSIHSSRCWAICIACSWRRMRHWSRSIRW